MVYSGVIGAGKCDEQTAAAAYEVGRETAYGFSLDNPVAARICKTVQ